MFKEVFLSSMLIFFAGCSIKNEKNLSKSLDQSLAFDTNMQKTEKIIIKDANETKMSLSLSYLNANESIIENDKSVNEKFIVGLYRADGIYSDTLIDDEESLSIHIDYPKVKHKERLTQEQRAQRAKGRDSLPLVVKRLALSDPLLKNMSMVNSWSSYYYIEFPHSISKTFTITYQTTRYGADEGLQYHLNFAKNGKYIYNKSKKIF